MCQRREHVHHRRADDVVLVHQQFHSQPNRRKTNLFLFVFRLTPFFFFFFSLRKRSFSLTPLSSSNENIVRARSHSFSVMANVHETLAQVNRVLSKVN